MQRCHRDRQPFLRKVVQQMRNAWPPREQVRGGHRHVVQEQFVVSWA